MLIEPDYNLESIYDIDIMELKEARIHALFFDLDSTIMKSKSGKFAFRTIQFLNNLKSIFKLAIITNNKKESYIEEVRKQIDIPIFYNAKKPNTKILLKACQDLSVFPENVAMIGDRPLSDILGGKRAKMMTILVDSISKNDENILTRGVRYLERLTIKKS